MLLHQFVQILKYLIDIAYGICDIVNLVRALLHSVLKLGYLLRLYVVLLFFHNEQLIHLLLFVIIIDEVKVTLFQAGVLSALVGPGVVAVLILVILIATFLVGRALF